MLTTNSIWVHVNGEKEVSHGGPKNESPKTILNAFSSNSNRPLVQLWAVGQEHFCKQFFSDSFNNVWSWSLLQSSWWEGEHQSFCTCTANLPGPNTDAKPGFSQPMVCKIPQKGKIQLERRYFKYITVLLEIKSILVTFCHHLLNGIQLFAFYGGTTGWVLVS